MEENEKFCLTDPITKEKYSRNKIFKLKSSDTSTSFIDN